MAVIQLNMLYGFKVNISTPSSIFPAQNTNRFWKRKPLIVV